MRKITEDAIRAFRNNQNFKRGNTQVEVCELESKRRLLLLHGNIIACVDFRGDLWLDACGYKTVTTKERLNGFPSVNIVQKNFEWFLNGEKWDGEDIRVEW